MTAISFQPMFVEPIKAKVKIGTIRGQARGIAPGRELQLWCRMRRPERFLFGLGNCVMVQGIRLDFDARLVEFPEVGGLIEFVEGLDLFAATDGFPDGWGQMEAFWAKHHPGVRQFTGVQIQWGDTYRTCDPDYRVTKRAAKR